MNLSTSGSPPHMRGKEIWRLRWTTRKRITPAYAGKSFRGGFWGGNCRDHPRVCGEKIEQRIRDYQAGGSPPHMRGKGVQQSDSGVRVGITPAYAGKRRREDGVTFRLEDHPRICGEKSVQLFAFKVRIRITPAYAGKSLLRPVDFPRIWDHPRICGEKL